MDTKWNTKYIFQLLLMLIVLIILSGCSAKAKPDSAVIEDIKMYFIDTYSYISFDDVNVVIDRRQTNTDSKEDYVWATVTANNDDISYIGSFDALYVLYNEGWELQYCQCTDSQFQLLRSTVSETDAKNLVWDELLGPYRYVNNVTLEYRDTDLQDFEDTFVYIGEYTVGHMTTINRLEVQYVYSLVNGWTLESIDLIESTQEWNGLGKWVCNSDDGTMWIYIHSIDDNSISIEYDFDYSIMVNGWYRKELKTVHCKSDGIETRELSEYGDEKLCFFLTRIEGELDTYTGYIYLSSTQGLTFDGIYGFDDDAFVFTYEGK